jgi:hypothetical protein
MNNETAQIVTLITNTVKRHGCSIKNIDVDNHVVELEGPEDKEHECALALAELFNG